MKQKTSFNKAALSALVVIILFSVIILACKKNQVFSSDLETSLTQREKNFVISWITAEKSKSVEKVKYQIDTLLATSDWGNAVKIATSNSSYSIFYVPVSNRRIGLSFFYDERKNHIDSGNIVLVDSRNNESPIRGIKTYFDNIVLHTEGRNSFSGSISSYSFSNKHLYDYGFINGDTYWHGIYAPRKASNQLIRTNSVEQKGNSSYDCEWWGHFTRWSDGSTTLDYTYLVCKLTDDCQTTLIKTPEGYKLIKTNCGGGGGEPDPDPFGIDCESFIFVKTASNWQEAGVKNHRMNMVWMGGERHSLSISLTIASPIIIGVPLERDNGRIKYSSGKAAEIAADIVQKATIMTHQLLKNEPYRPTDAMIEETFRRYLHDIAVLYGGTAGRTGSGNSAIYINNNPKYKIFGTGSCE